MAIYRDRDEDFEDLMNKGALWSVTYGDLMSFLMIFFLMLFLFSIGGKKRLAEGLSGMQKRFGGETSEAGLEGQRDKERELAMAEQMQTKLHSAGLEKFASVEVTERRIRVVLREPVLFLTGEAVLKSGAMPMLREFAETVREMPNLVVVEGHTDDVPIASGRFQSNWELSMARAASVIGYLTKEGGIEPSRVSGVGFAEYHPAAPNDTPEGRAKNRRIELSLIRKEL
jgi:chemotaxis protein MotB